MYKLCMTDVETYLQFVELCPIYGVHRAQPALHQPTIEYTHESANQKLEIGIKCCKFSCRCFNLQKESVWRHKESVWRHKESVW